MNTQQTTTQYHIYGRHSYAQPLTYIQTIAASAPNTLPAPEGEDWIELIAFPASAVIRVIPHEPKQSNWTPIHTAEPR